MERRNPRSSAFMLLVLTTTLTAISVQAQVHTMGPPGGRVGGIAINPRNPSIVYANTERGSMFRTFDKGQTSEAMLAFPSSGGGPMVLHPQNPSIIYTSIFKSTDAGLSWTRMSGGGSCLALNPLNPEVIFATAHERDIEVTRDGGSTWSTLATLPTDARLIAISSADTSVLYAGGVPTFYRSTNAGQSWTDITTASLGGIYSTSIAIQQGSTDIVYLGTDDRGVLKTTDGGLTWSEILSQTDVNQVVVDPTDTARIYAVTGEEYWWEVPGHVFRSNDGGTHWSTADTGLPDSVNRYLYALAINPQTPEELYLGTYGWGVYRTQDRGESWQQTNLTSPPVMSITLNGDSAGHMTVGTYDEGILLTRDGGTTWGRISVGPEPTIGAYFHEYCRDPNDPQTAYITSLIFGLFQTTDGGQSWQLTSMTGSFDTYIYTMAVHPTGSDTVFVGQTGWMGRDLYRSTDRAVSWTNVTPEWSPVPILQILFAPDNLSIMYAAAGDRWGVLKSTDGGRSWTPKQTGLSLTMEEGLALQVRGLAVRSEAPNVLYAVQAASGKHTGSVSKSVDGGETWFKIDSMLSLTNPQVSGHAVAISPLDRRRIYVGLYPHGFDGAGGKGGLFVTADEGKNWQTLYEGAVDIIGVDPFTPSTVYAGTSFGILKILDTTVVTVDEEDSGIPHGFLLHQNYPNPFNSMTRISFATGEKMHVKLSICDVLGRQVRALVDGIQNSGHHEIIWDGRNEAGHQMSSGLYFYTLKGGGGRETKRLALIR